LEFAFWILLLIVFYTFAGYAILLVLLLFFKKRFSSRKNHSKLISSEWPLVCMFVTAYNERNYIDAKVKNLFELDYPKDKIQFLWMTDGSDDGTPDLLKQYPMMEIHHLPERNGKIHAMNRGMKFVKGPIVIFSDSNTLLCPQAIRVMVDTFRDPHVGCIAGEKRIENFETDGAAGSGEGVYWKYESWVKQMDSELNSVIGAAGELFAIRTELYSEVENDTILDDFIISLRIAEKGYRIAYAPDAYAIESASLNISEELKRKIRIAAGGLQTLGRLKELLNPFHFGWLSFQYLSHKVLRWTIAPLALFAILIINFSLVFRQSDSGLYFIILFVQLFLYLLALLGWLLERRKIRFKFFFVPFYFLAMNYAVIRGIIRFLFGKQSVNWEKSKRV
jgi:cellulose synthase/poly-beta-1,6-N-acetylglucosamine synthase-like glycosyltransferase